MRMRKSRRTANGVNLAGLIPGHYLTLLSDLRDSVLYIGDLLLLSLSLCCVCISRFVCLFGVVQVNCYSALSQCDKVIRLLSHWRFKAAQSVKADWVMYSGNYAVISGILLLLRQPQVSDDRQNGIYHFRSLRRDIHGSRNTFLLIMVDSALCVRYMRQAKCLACEPHTSREDVY